MDKSNLVVLIFVDWQQQSGEHNKDCCFTFTVLSIKVCELKEVMGGNFFSKIHLFNSEFNEAANHLYIIQNREYIYNAFSPIWILNLQLQEKEKSLLDMALGTNSTQICCQGGCCTSIHWRQWETTDMMEKLITQVKESLSGRYDDFLISSICVIIHDQPKWWILHKRWK